MCCEGLTIIFREAHAEMSFLDLLSEHIFLVEEEYNGGGGKVAVVADTVEQVQTLMHSILKEKRVSTNEKDTKTQIVQNIKCKAVNL